MKSLRLFLLLACTLAPAAFGQEEREPTVAERLLKLMRFEQTGFEAAKAAFRPFVDQFRQQGLPEAALKEIEAAADAYFHQLMSDPELKKDILKLYEETFSEAELEEMLAFYQTPTGQKALLEMPKIMASGMALGEKYAEKYAPAFEEQLAEILEKHQDLPGEGDE